MDPVNQSEGGDARQSRASATANAEEDVNQPLASTTANADENYGSTSEDKPKNPHDIFLEKMHKYGGPMVLLIAAWAALMPVIAPLLVVTITSMKSGDFNVRCANLENFTPQRIVCDLTLPVVCFFPGVTQAMSIGLVTWRFARQRLFYVFLQRKILIDFDNSTYFARVVTVTVLSMFSLSIVHFCLLLKFGYIGGRFGVDISHRGHPQDLILKTSFWELMKNPESLLEDQNKILVFFITKLALVWLVPAVVAIAFTQDISDTETSLVPLSKLYEDAPNYIHQHMGESVGVTEDVAREILQVDEDGQPALLAHSDCVVTSKRTSIATVEIINLKVDVDKACNTFRKEVFSFDGDCVIGGQADMESAPPPACQKVTLPPITLLDMATKPWWPLHIILKEDQSIKEGLQFRTAWIIHCVLCSVVLGADFILKIYGLINSIVDLSRPDGVAYFGVSTCLVYWSMSVPITFVEGMAVKGLVRTAYDTAYGDVEAKDALEVGS